MNRVKIRIDTLRDVNRFLRAVGSTSGEVILTNDKGYTVNGKSYLGVVYASAEWTDIYCLSEEILSEKIMFLIVDDD